jgi:coenzyme F420-0:L-glutamate ligase
MEIRAIQTRIFLEGENLVRFITEHVPALEDGSILVVTSKIVALAESRTAPLGTKEDKEKLIRAESDVAIKTKLVWLTIRQGLVMANAGVDESNADGKIILLPKDSFDAAKRLRDALKKHYGVRRLGILITDSRLFPLRAGVVGVALGYAGFAGVRDERGQKDIYGRKLKMTRIDVADSVATAAVLEMGEAAERQPLAVVTDARVEFKERVDRKELLVDIREDLYQPLFASASKKRK